MYYFVLLGVGLTLIRKRRIQSIFLINLKYPWVMISCVVIQIALEVITHYTFSKHPVLFEATFVTLLLTLYTNRKLPGIIWVMLGNMLNTIALLTHHGLMPVSKLAMHIAKVESNNFILDSRHQLMTSSFFDFLGDWIPFFTPVGHNFILSPGDIILGIGLVIFIYRNSSVRGTNHEGY